MCHEILFHESFSPASHSVYPVLLMHFIEFPYPPIPLPLVAEILVELGNDERGVEIIKR
jgi:hypothetical protein